MKFEEFENLVKDALANMYDFAAMETHPIIGAALFPPEDYKGSKGEYLRQVLLETIESFKPSGIEYDLFSNEWRAYIILHQRYVENISNQDLAKKLLLGERQIRRSQKKAVQAAATQLWDRLSVDNQSRIDKFGSGLKWYFKIAEQPFQPGRGGSCFYPFRQSQFGF
jgi:AAA15 family ATPase/GTPase